MTDEGLPADRLNKILTAIETIEESLGVLARKQRVDRAEYKMDSDTRDIVERRFVKMTEAAIDIAEEIVKHEQGHPPASNPASMRELGEIGILSGSLAEKMAQGARFRNVLSHTYGNIINHDVVYNALQDLERYRSFVEAVQVYLESSDVLDS
ncbi:type VII toxin-antitoxin system HepT family RNase toxin [Halorubrum xinjiangense]|uniref:type VII toxin-antitoxin system HepT family RNase toxin n=1 Tax=Halorubrum xinjiangense TaxID=261291 RepID=UPI003C6FB3C8